MKLYMFRTVRLSIIRSLFTVHSAVIYVIQVCRQLSSRTWPGPARKLSVVYKLVRHIPLLSVQRINSWWWKEELSESCRVSWQNKFVKLLHLVGFVIKKSAQTNLKSQLSNWNTCRAVSYFTILVQVKNHQLIPHIQRCWFIVPYKQCWDRWAEYIPVLNYEIYLEIIKKLNLKWFWPCIVVIMWK